MPTMSFGKALDQLVLRNQNQNLSLNEKEVISNIVSKLKFISFFRTLCFVRFPIDDCGKLLLDGLGHPIGFTLSRDVEWPLAERPIF